MGTNAREINDSGAVKIVQLALSRRRAVFVRPARATMSIEFSLHKYIIIIIIFYHYYTNSTIDHSEHGSSVRPICIIILPQVPPSPFLRVDAREKRVDVRTAAS